MNQNNNLPSISVCMATLNAAIPLKECLQRLFKQNYPVDKIELIVADGGSTDQTRELIKNYEGQIFDNTLKTGEAGKAVAVKQAKNDLILILDSDNYLPEKNWLKKMVKPFQDPEIKLAEPIEYTWRKQGGYIERYCALIGMNDPLCLFLGNYDRWNHLTQKWTEVAHRKIDRGDYLKIELNKQGIPTIGANGTIFRRQFLQNQNINDYLFDIDIIAQEIQKHDQLYIAKVKIGIIHTFCENDFKKFIRKQKRRIKDYIFHKKNQSRTFDWDKFNFGGKSSIGLYKFIIYTLLTFPLLFQALKGFMKKKDFAWFFHVPACWVTLLIYSWGKLSGIFYQTEFNRDKWSQ